MGEESNTSGIGRWAGLAGALALLNVSLTFGNVWPTLAIRTNSDLSVEAALCVLVIALARRLFGAPSRSALRWLTAVWVVLVIGRYVEVTARSLYGRDINLYWDLRLMPDVGAMFAFVANPLLLLLVVAVVVLLPLGIYSALRWALGYVSDAAADPLARRALMVLSCGVLLASIIQAAGPHLPRVFQFASPVTQVYAREVRELAYEMSGAGVRQIPPPVAMTSDLSRVKGADVLLIFLESYGAVSWERPEFARALAATREGMNADIRETGRGVASAFIESTTFGGESWLAHISLLSGTSVRDQDTNVRLMAQDRDTLVKVFGRHGYRTVGIMPGIQRNWPEGRFYGFDDIYDAERLDYEGPPFGWWDITDQYALAKVDAAEIAPASRAPVFAVFPTLSTHAPFTPAPPYQPDWARVLTATPHDDAVLQEAWAQQADWMNLSPSYVQAMRYAYATIGGYLRHRADRDLVVVVVGDHQPPALVSGEGASWEVPVHVITSHRAILDRLQAHGFRDGLMPQQPRVATMDTLLAILLDAFGD